MDVETFSTYIDPCQPCYAVIDPFVSDVVSFGADGSISEEALQEKREEYWGTSYIYPVELNRHGRLEHWWRPYLVMLPPSNRLPLAISLKQSTQTYTHSQAGGMVGDGTAIHRMGTWVQSGLDVEVLLHKLAVFMRLRLQSDMSFGKIYLRLADPRVLALVHHAVGDAKFSALMGSYIGKWLYLKADLTVGVINGDPRSELPVDAPLELSSRAWGEVQCGDIIHCGMARALGHERAAGRQIDVAMGMAAIGFADTLSRRFARLFDAPDDWSAAVALGLLYGRSWVHTPDVQTILSQQNTAPKKERQTLHHLTAQLVECLEEQYA